MKNASPLCNKMFVMWSVQRVLHKNPGLTSNRKWFLREKNCLAILFETYWSQNCRKELLSLPWSPAHFPQLPVLLWGCGFGIGIYSSVLQNSCCSSPRESKGGMKRRCQCIQQKYCSAVGESPRVKWARNHWWEGDAGTHPWGGIAHTEEGSTGLWWDRDLIQAKTSPNKLLSAAFCVPSFFLQPKPQMNSESPLSHKLQTHSHQQHKERVPGYCLNIRVPQLLQPLCSLWINKLSELLGSIKR